MTLSALLKRFNFHLGELQLAAPVVPEHSIGVGAVHAVDSTMPAAADPPSCFVIQSEVGTTGAVVISVPSREGQTFV